MATLIAHDPDLDEAPMPPSGQSRPAVSWRSVLLGLVGVCFICGLTAFNDYVVNNTYMVGNFLPVGLVIFFLLLIFLVNAPLWKFFPRLAFGRGELAVVLGMVLVSCALPSSGLMRYLPGHLIEYHQRANEDPQIAQLLDDMHFPDWMFPKFQHTGAADRGGEAVVRDYIGRVYVDHDHDNFLGHLKAVPWALWRAPAVAWGIFLVGFYGMFICLSVIVRRQWVDNERLAFPLATVYLALIDEPAPGRAVNAMFRSPGFWLAFASVFLIHIENGLYVYNPARFPKIPIGFNVTDVLSSQIWSFTSYGARSATIFFSIVGICFFLQTKVAFSLWFFYIIINIARMVLGQSQVEYTPGMQQDELFGACIPFVLSILWIGRQQWMIVLKQMFRPPEKDEPRGRYLPYFLAGWGLALCTALVVGWLMMAGASFVGAAVLVLMLTLLLMIVTRIVAETGLIFVQIPLPISRPWIYAGQNFGHAYRTTEQSYFLTGMFNTLFAHDARECLPVFSTHALRIADTAAFEGERGWRKGIKFTACLVLALAVGYVVSGASMLYTEYAYGQTLDKSQSGPINHYGVLDSSANTLNAIQQYRPPNSGLRETHNRLGHFTGGAVVCAALSILRVRYVSWPLNPVGLLLCTSYPMETIWFSVFLGWLAKLLIVQFGGTQGFRKARNIFVGLIVGEASAAAFWLIVSLCRLALGMQFTRINLLPT